MANIRVGIVEDEMIIAQGIARALRDLGYEPTEPAISYTEAMGMMAAGKPDIILIDIQLKGHKDGIELAQKIKEDYNIPFIFLTANADAATVARARLVNPSAYLVKPFSKEDLYTSIEVCLHNFAAGSHKSGAEAKDALFIKDRLFIKQGQYYKKVKKDDIMYLESDGVYVHVHTAAARLLVRNSIQSYLELIDDRRFIRVHKSYAVNTACIESVSADSMLIKSTEIPIGRAYRDELMAFLRIG